jgi:Nuclease A inhibitor-like protein
MSRVSKADVNAVLQRTAQKIIDAGGSDGRTSRAEMSTALKGLTGKEKALTDVFFKFIDHRDFKAGAQVTSADVKRAVAYAKTTLVAKYDLDNNGLTKAEISKMSLTGKLAVSLAKELKSAAVDGGTTQGGAAFAKTLTTLTKDIRFDHFGTESDAPWKSFSTKLAGTKLDAASFKASLELPSTPVGEVTQRSAAEFFTAMADTGPDAPLGSDAERAAYKALGEAMNKNLKDVKVFLVGADSVVQGKVYLVGRSDDGKLVGLNAPRIWT